MKVSSFCALFLVVGSAFMLFMFLSPTVASLFPDFVATSCGESGDKPTLTAVSRKLKENGRTMRSNKKVDLDDYRPINPVPVSGGESFVHAPVQHGTPLNPFIPKPPPPSNPE